MFAGAAVPKDMLDIVTAVAGVKGLAPASAAGAGFGDTAPVSGRAMLKGEGAGAGAVSAGLIPASAGLPMLKGEGWNNVVGGSDGAPAGGSGEAKSGLPPGAWADAGAVAELAIANGEGAGVAAAPEGLPGDIIPKGEGWPEGRPSLCRGMATARVSSGEIADWNKAGQTR